MTRFSRGNLIEKYALAVLFAYLDVRLGRGDGLAKQSASLP
jgi:hypothetical protein